MRASKSEKYFRLFPMSCFKINNVLAMWPFLSKFIIQTKFRREVYSMIVYSFDGNFWFGLENRRKFHFLLFRNTF